MKENTFLGKLGLDRPELRAWAMYDWANSAMVTVVITALFPPFFYAVAAPELGKGQVEAPYAIATAASIFLAAILSPILGAIADFSGIKKRLLAVFMMIGVLAVAAMFFIDEGGWRFAAILFFLGNLGLMGSFVFYDALLPHVAKGEEMHRVSTAGYALGYIGGGCLLAGILWMIVRPDFFGLPSGDVLSFAEETLPVRIAFVVVAVWWMVFSIPLFLRVLEPPAQREPDEQAGQNPVKVAFVRLLETFRELRQFRDALLMLVAFLLYSDGIGTIIRMAVIYGTGIGLERNTMIMAILITQFVGIPCAFGFGMLAGKMGAKRAIFLGLAVYMVISILGYLMTSAAHFIALAVLLGMVQGGTQALSRSLFASLIPSYKSGELFGFFGVMDKFSGTMGSTLIAGVTVLTGNPRLGVLGVIGFFFLGGFLLFLVNPERGSAAAKSAEARVAPAK